MTLPQPGQRERPQAHRPSAAQRESAANGKAHPRENAKPKTRFSSSQLRHSAPVMAGPWRVRPLARSHSLVQMHRGCRIQRYDARRSRQRRTGQDAMLHLGPDPPRLLGITAANAELAVGNANDTIHREAAPVWMIPDRQDERSQVSMLPARLSLLTAEACVLAHDPQPMPFAPSSCCR